VGTNPLICFQPGTDHLQLFGPFWGVSSLETTGLGLIGSDFHAHWAECPPFLVLWNISLFSSRALDNFRNPLFFSAILDYWSVLSIKSNMLQ